MAGRARCTHDGLSGHIVGVHIKDPVGIFAEEIVTTDTLGRRTGPRSRHTIEEKLRIVEETRARGASVATVARQHNVNPTRSSPQESRFRGPHVFQRNSNGDTLELRLPAETFGFGLSAGKLTTRDAREEQYMRSTQSVDPARRT